MLNVVVLEGYPDKRAYLRKLFDNEKDFNLLLCTDNGRDGLAAIKKHKPELIVTGMFLSHIDGLGVIEEVRAKRWPCKIILILDHLVNSTIKMAVEAGVNYVVAGAIDDDVLIRHIHSVLDENVHRIEIKEAKLKKVRGIVKHILDASGFKASLKGYHYLIDAVVLCYDDDELMSSKTKILYPAIAKRNNVPSLNVERSIRNAINIAWDKCNGGAFYEIIDCQLKTNKKPSVSEIIAHMLGYVKTLNIEIDPARDL